MKGVGSYAAMAVEAVVMPFATEIGVGWGAAEILMFETYPD